MPLNCSVGEDSWEPLGLQGDPTSSFWRRSALVFLWREWCWSWNSSSLATSCEELTHWKSLWCWERLRAGGEGDDRGWDGWMASLTRWTWVWVNSGSWWWTGRPGMLRFIGSQRVGHDWLNWTELRPLQHNYWACALELRSCNYLAHVLQLLKALHPWAQAPQQDKPPQWETHTLQLESGPHSLQLEKRLPSNEDPAQPKINHFKKINSLIKINNEQPYNHVILG